MSDSVFTILVLIAAFGIIFGVAYMLDSRKKQTSKTNSKISLGPISRIVLWISYGLILITILFLVGAFTFNQVFFAGLAKNFIYLYIIIGIVYRIIKPRGI